MRRCFFTDSRRGTKKLNGKVIVALLVFPAIFAGAALYYLQIFSFYEEIVPDGKTDISILQKKNELPEVINYSNFRAISSDSSPIRYRLVLKHQKILMFCAKFIWYMKMQCLKLLHIGSTVLTLRN